MPEAGSSDSARTQLEKRLHPRVQCEDRVMFDTPAKEGCGGVIKAISLSGCLLITIEQVSVGTELVIYLSLVRGEDKTSCGVSAKIVNLNSQVEKPLRGYGVMFNLTNPEVVKEAIRQVVDAKKKAARPSSPVVPVPHVAKPLEERTEASADELLLPETEEKAATGKRSAPSRSTLIALGVVVVLTGGYYLFSKLQESSLASHFKGVVPVEGIRVADGDVFADVGSDWINRTPSDEKRRQLLQVGKILTEQRLGSAQFFDAEGKRVAMVVVPLGAKNPEISVRLDGE